MNASINAANVSPGPHSLVLARKCTYTLQAPDNPGNGLPVIVGDLKIHGNGATITRATSAPAFRILAVGPTGALILNDVTVSRGLAIDCPPAPGTEVICGGGILSNGRLTVNHSRVIDNTASGAPIFFVEGGGVEGNGPATTGASLAAAIGSRNTSAAA